MDVNMWGVLHCLAAFVPGMAKQPGPSIIATTASRAGVTTPPGDTAYNVSKAAVRVITEVSAAVGWSLSHGEHAWACSSPAAAALWNPAATQQPSASSRREWHGAHLNTHLNTHNPVAIHLTPLSVPVLLSVAVAVVVAVQALAHRLRNTHGCSVDVRLACEPCRCAHGKPVPAARAAREACAWTMLDE